MPSPTSQCCIYEFSKKFDDIQQKNGIWVSGGFEIDKTKAFFRSNYGQGTINEIPFEIRQAVIDGLFEIPNAYPPNPLRNNEFLQKVVNGQLDIAAPPLKDIALIARELNDYCVLAVATRQMDDKWRSKMVGYRYFWLKTSDLNQGRGVIFLPNQLGTLLMNDNSDDSVDGIATLLWWWHENGRPCFDMNPNPHENTNNKNQFYSIKKVRNKNENISRASANSKIAQLNSRRVFEPTTDGKLNVWDLHAQALDLCNTTMQKPAWAWNVRKLTKPETFTVVYCADRASYDQFFSAVLKSIEPPSNLAKYLKDVASNTESSSLRSLIEFYQKNPPSKHRDLWINSVNQEILTNPNKKRYQADINSLILVSVFIWDVPEQEQTKDDYTFSENEKFWALEYLDALSGSISKYENQTAYKQAVGKLKQNIANLRESLSGEDESNGGDSGLPSNWPNAIIKRFMDIGSRPYYQWLIIPLFLLVFFSFLPLENTPLKPIFYKIIGVQLFPEPKKGGGQGEKPNPPLPDLEKLEAARSFIDEKSVTKECGDGGQSATTSKCQIYQETKNQLPEWPSLPEPPANAVPPSGKNSHPKMLAKSRGLNNPPELVAFLQQSLKVWGATNVGNLDEFDDILENSVKEFQEKLKLEVDGQVGEHTWKILSDYVQKKQVITILDYRIKSLNQGKTDREINEAIQKCKKPDPQKHQNYIKPEDFIKCLKPTQENPNGS